jgi:hypothetical protein
MKYKNINPHRELKVYYKLNRESVNAGLIAILVQGRATCTAEAIFVGLPVFLQG